MNWLCVISTPFGLPVVPDVYITTASEVGLGGLTGISEFLAFPALTTSSTERICDTQKSDVGPKVRSKLCTSLNIGNFLRPICSVFLFHHVFGVYNHLCALVLSTRALVTLLDWAANLQSWHLANNLGNLWETDTIAEQK